MKKFSRILAMVLVTTLCFVGIAFAADTTAPYIYSSRVDGSTLEGGTALTITVIDNESKITNMYYNWDGGTNVNLVPSVKVAANRCEVTNVKLSTVAGKHVLTVTAVNSEGKSTTSKFNYIVKENDTTGPVITSSVGNNATVNSGSNVYITVKDDSRLISMNYAWGNSITNTLSFASQNINTYTYRIDKFPNVSGTYKLTVTAEDKLGNSTTKTFTYYVECQDTTAPTISMSEASGKTLPGDTRLILTVIDNESKVTTLKYNWDGESVISMIPSVKEPANYCEISNIALGTLPGTYNFNVTAVNSAGKSSSKTFTYIVAGTSSSSEPTIEVSPNGGNLDAGTDVKIIGRDNEGLKSIAYSWDNNSTVTKSVSGTKATVDTEVPNGDGKHVLTVTVKDTDNNSIIDIIYFVVDDDNNGEAPTVDADPDGGEVEYGDKITITAEADDGDIKYIEYYWDDGDDDTTKKSKDKITVKVPSDEGKHYLYVRAKDDNGNICDYERFTYKVVENDYPGNSDDPGDINTRVRSLRVEIRNADDKIKFEPDEEILYYVDYYNGTSSKISNAKIVVELPAYLEGDKASDSGKISSKQITWNLGTLSSGDYGRVSFKAHYTSSKTNEKIIVVPAKIYSGSSLKDTSTVRNLIFSEGASGTGSHKAYCIGYPDGTFLPEGSITRAELAAMICNIEGITSNHVGQFTDANNHWASNYMQAAYEHGYMKAKSYNYFGAQESATRADLAYAIASILDVEDLEPIFIAATDTRNSEVRCAIEQLLRLGIMEGYSDGTAKPNSIITRAEAVTIINNYLFRGELYTNSYNYSYNFENNYNYGGNNYTLRFTDLSTNHWAYGQIMEATNNHRYERVIDGNEEML